MPDLYTARLSLIFGMTVSFGYIDNSIPGTQTNTLKNMYIMLMQRLTLDRTTARTGMLRTGSKHEGQPS